MNTQAILPLDDLLVQFNTCQFVISRRDVVNYEGVLEFVAKARNKALNDFNIASLIMVQTPTGLVPAIVLSKQLATAEAATASAVAVYTPYLSHTSRYGTIQLAFN